MIPEYKNLHHFTNEFEEELDSELEKYQDIKDKLRYLYTLQRQNQSNNTLSGGVVYYGMIVQNKIQYYESSLNNPRRKILLKQKSLAKNYSSDQSLSDKIIWRKDQKDLLILIEKLIEYGFIGYHKEKISLILDHFISQTEVLNATQLKILSNRKKAEPEKYPPGKNLGMIIADVISEEKKKILLKNFNK